MVQRKGIKLGVASNKTFRNNALDYFTSPSLGTIHCDGDRIGYSMNKQKRWEIIGELQKQNIHVEKDKNQRKQENRELKKQQFVEKMESKHKRNKKEQKSSEEEENQSSKGNVAFFSNQNLGGRNCHYMSSQDQCEHGSSSKIAHLDQEGIFADERSTYCVHVPITKKLFLNYQHDMQDCASRRDEKTRKHKKNM